MDYMDQQPNLQDLIPLSDAAILAGFSDRHIRKLVTQKIIWGIKLGRNWFTTKQEINIYKSIVHKTGPKPKKS